METVPKNELYRAFDFRPAGFGDAPEPKAVVVCLHGIGVDSHNWQTMFDTLNFVPELRAFRFVAFDWLGFGHSYTDDSLDYNYNEELTALENSIKALNMPKNLPIILLGHSMGTLLATHYALNHPEVKQLTLVSPALFHPDEIRYLLANQAANSFLDKVDPTLLTQKSFVSCMKNIIMNETNFPTFLETKIPMDLIYGRQDMFISHDSVKKVGELNKNAHVYSVNGRHGPTGEKIPLVQESLERFLENNG